MEINELIQWLRNNSSGVYRPAKEAADRLETMERARAACRSVQDAVTISSGDLLCRISNHIAMLSPQQKERMAGKLLIEAKERLQKLEAAWELFINPLELEQDAMAGLSASYCSEKGPKCPYCQKLFLLSEHDHLNNISWSNVQCCGKSFCIQKITKVQWVVSANDRTERPMR